jgi:NAD(P)-dependent dehydrogenase (short-subunit alcohol dehydrogenase family)
MNLDGKVVILTGAAGGIGTACAERYARDGASVVCTDRAESVNELAARLTSEGFSAVAVVTDIATEAGNRSLVDAALTSFGRLDAIHCNAAIQIMGSVEQMTIEQWEQTQTTNLRAAFLASRAGIPAMREGGGGTIVFTASVLGLVGDPDLAAYGAMKGGLRALCRSLATAHGPENIRCNTICPGDVETPLVQEFLDFQDDPDAARRAITDRYPLRRFAQPADIAAVASFLASDDAAYITGTDILVDGGLLARVY